MSYLQIKERRIIPRGWEKFFDSNWELVSDILSTLYNCPYKFVPHNDEIFRMFYEISPKDINVVIIGQSPYLDDNACGIPFITRNNTTTKTLSNISKELSRQYRHAKIINPNKIITKWVDEGIFMADMSFSAGIATSNMRECDKYVLNHDTLWEEFVRNLVKYIAKKKKRKIPIILLGTIAWALEDEVMSRYHVIKAPFPTRDDFVGSGIFSQCDELVDGISWL